MFDIYIFGRLIYYSHNNVFLLNFNFQLNYVLIVASVTKGPLSPEVY